MRVGIVGAGMAGLAAARSLVAAGHEAVVFEKSRGVGGRAATRRKDGFVWDTGATVVPAELADLLPDDAVRIEKPVWLHDGLAARPGDSHRDAGFAFPNGVTTLAKAMAEGLDVRRETRVESLTDLRDEFDALVVTAPLPQTQALLATVGEDRGLEGLRYRPCLSVLLGFEVPLPETPYAFLLSPGGEHPLQWVSLEKAKCPARAPALVAQMSTAFSETHYDRAAEEVVGLALGHLRELFDLPDPVASDVMRWRYSQPRETGDLDAANPPGARIVVASDGLIGGKLHHAVRAGRWAARRVAAL